EQKALICKELCRVASKPQPAHDIRPDQLLEIPRVKGFLERFRKEGIVDRCAFLDEPGKEKVLKLLRDREPAADNARRLQAGLQGVSSALQTYRKAVNVRGIDPSTAPRFLYLGYWLGKEEGEFRRADNLTAPGERPLALFTTADVDAIELLNLFATGGPV